MNDLEAKQMILDYNEWFKIYGDNYQSVGWNKPKADERFNIFYDEFKYLFDNNNCTIIDLGCGLGHFYQYLLDKGIKCDYTGVDINPNFIDFCKNKYTNQKFICKSILDINLSADIIVASGLFNRKFEN